MPAESSSEPGPDGKVERLIEKHALGDIGADLASRWTAEDPDERSSLRDLATFFNRRLLQAVLVEQGVDTLDGEVENHYRLLTDDDVSAADRTRAERRLERHGIDVDTLRSEFVSYQAIRTFLTEQRGVQYSETTRSTDQDTAREQIDKLRNRLISVTESKLDQIASNGQLTLGDHDVTVDVQVYCNDCGEQYEVSMMLDRGGCDCNR